MTPSTGLLNPCLSLRYVGVILFPFLIGPHIWFGAWFGVIKEQLELNKHMLKKDWIRTASDLIKFNTLNTGHNWEDLILHSRNQETRTSNNHNEIRGGPIFVSSLADAPSVALLMQHKLRCVDLNGRSWRTRKTGNRPSSTHIPWWEARRGGGSSSRNRSSIRLGGCGGQPEAAAAAGGLKRAVAVAAAGRRRRQGEQRWVSSAPSWLTKSTSPTPKTWSVESPNSLFGFLPPMVW